MTEQSKPKTLVVATSKTGNTMIVAHAVADAYTAGVLYTPETAPADLSHYDTVLLGFWCDKGDAPADMASFDMMTKMAGGLTPEREARRKESETHPDRLDCLNAVAAMAPLFN